MAIVSLAEAKAQLNINPDDTRDDEELASYLDALTPVVERETGLVIEPRDCTDEMAVEQARFITLTRIPVLALVSIARLDADEFVYDYRDLYVNTTTGKITVLTGRALTGYLLLSYRAGFDQVPDNIKRGALVILQHAWELQRGVGTTAAAAAAPEGWTPTQGFLVPNRAKEWLGAPMPGVP